MVGQDKRLATGFGLDSVEDNVVVTGVVMALTVDTTAMGFNTVSEVGVGTSSDSVLDKTPINGRLLVLEIELMVVISTFFLEVSSAIFSGGATAASTWSSSSRSPLRQLNINANFDDSTGRLLITVGSVDSPALGLTNEIPTDSSSSSSLLASVLSNVVFLSVGTVHVA